MSGPPISAGHPMAAREAVDQNARPGARKIPCVDDGVRRSMNPGVQVRHPEGRRDRAFIHRWHR